MPIKSLNSCDLTVIILTFNEELHIKRCIESVRDVAVRVIVIDSYSSDNTTKIAESLGAEVFQNPFVNYAKQFNWALDSLQIETEWILRLDADEYITKELAKKLYVTLKECGPNTVGFTVNLRRIFMGRWLKHGSLYPIRLLRIWRSGSGRCESRFMDEHIVVLGSIDHINADFVDHNLNNLTWWIDKHNKYASREAVDLLNLEYEFMPREPLIRLRVGSQVGLKRWLKERVYRCLPGGLRAFMYFIYRYLFRIGFLDGQAGFVFHALQGLWYRYLVDVKVTEVRRYMQTHNVEVTIAINQVLGIKL